MGDRNYQPSRATYFRRRKRLAEPSTDSSASSEDDHDMNESPPASSQHSTISTESGTRSLHDSHAASSNDGEAQHDLEEDINNEQGHGELSPPSSPNAEHLDDEVPAVENPPAQQPEHFNNVVPAREYPPAQPPHQDYVEDFLENPEMDDIHDEGGPIDQLSSDEEIYYSDEEGLTDEEEENQEELPGHDPPLYAGAPVTLGQSLLAILTFSLVHNLTGVAVADLLALIAMHCVARDSLCKRTLYQFRKFFQTMKSPVKCHYYCSKCFKALQSKDAICEELDCQTNFSVSYFLEVSIISQLSSMFQRDGFLQDLNFRFQRTKKDLNNYEDIYDGNLYKGKVQEGFLSERSNISFTWNTDGASIFKSSKFSIWPFYLAINELCYSKRFKTENVVIAGLWFGPSKPEPWLFLSSFHEDLANLYQGVNFDAPGQEQPVRVRATVLCGTCDLPAKGTFLNIMQYNAYHGCPNCKVRGERSERTDNQHAYPYVESDVRTNENTRQYATLAEQYSAPIFGVKGFSALGLYAQDYIISTSIDVMHCVYLGVVKKLMLLWFDEHFHNEPFSLRGFAAQVNNKLAEITPPSFVKRMPRSVTEHLCYWKSQEFKSFFFYYSIPILSEIMSPEYFNHYLLLVHSLYLLNQESISEASVDTAEACLTEFVIKLQDLYGYKFLGINFHMLLHLGQTVRNFGPLWTTSCMPFENLNGRLVRLVHGTRHAGLQITAALCQVVSLPILLSKLNPNDDVRKWCEKLLNRQVIHTTELITGEMSVVGKYTYLQNIPPEIHVLLVDAGTVPSNVSLFYKLKKGKLLYYSQSYGRNIQTSSVAVKYSSDNRVRYGIIKYFVRVSQCDCMQRCDCDAEFFAIISVLHCEVPFQIVHPQLNVSHIMTSRELETKAVKVQSLITIWFLIEQNGTQFIINPVNVVEDE